MCARYTLTLDNAKLVIAGLVRIFGFVPRYNIGPAQRVPVIIDTPAGVKDVEMRWGIPSEWSKTLHINAQAERIQQTTTFKPLLGQRCLVPMDGFYEWKPDKSPVRFIRRRRELFCVAGLWKDVEKPGIDLPLTERCFVLLTTAAIPSVAPIHDRMPFIVRDEQYDWWLREGMKDTVLNFADDTPLDWYPVSREVNNVRNENPDLIRLVPVKRELF
jgi:putative SOS response-associated peptidase YedK